MGPKEKTTREEAGREEFIRFKKRDHYIHHHLTTMSIFGLGKKSQTFKPHKNIPEGTKQYQLKKYAEATLGSGNLKLAVTLPEGEDINEWLAVNTVDFFNQINMLYGTITEFCTPQECPVMSAGPKYEYMWADGVNVKKAIKCSAPEYVDFLMTWVQEQLDDEEIFPSKVGVPFPKSLSLGEEAHLNTSFKHFIFFVQEFNLINKKELQPLAELISSLTNKKPS